jgi:pyruvate ferredoxin oxidoreductase gamma subunit
MFRIRFHGRGGQGIKTAGRMLGTAFFLQGYEVQDAPLYGAERRGAPVFAYVRAAKSPILERGVIRQADLVVVADDSLIAMPAAGVLNGVTGNTVLLILSGTGADIWQQRLNFPGRILTLPSLADGHVASPLCAGAAACLSGVVAETHLREAMRRELSSLPEALVQCNIDEALQAWTVLSHHAGIVREGTLVSAERACAPDWIELPLEAAAASAPAIHAGLTSLAARTGLWRTLRPVIDYDRCNRCWWVCSEFCPDGAISVAADGTPRIDYDHCKGCLICVAQCPPHAIAAVPEHEAAEETAP